MLQKSQLQNFETLTRAFAVGAVCLVACTEKESGKPVAVVCAVESGNDEVLELVPLARLFDGNPYAEVVPPPVKEDTCVMH